VKLPFMAPAKSKTTPSGERKAGKGSAAGKTKATAKKSTTATNAKAQASKSRPKPRPVPRSSSKIQQPTPELDDDAAAAAQALLGLNRRGKKLPDNFFDKALGITPSERREMDEDNNDSDFEIVGSDGAGAEGMFTKSCVLFPCEHKLQMEATPTASRTNWTPDSISLIMFHTAMLHVPFPSPTPIPSVNS
jgi:hypothetical protein